MKLEKLPDKVISSVQSTKDLKKNNLKSSTNSLIYIKTGPSKIVYNTKEIISKKNSAKNESPKMANLSNNSDPKRTSTEFTTNSTENNSLPDNFFNDSLSKNYDYPQLSTMNSYINLSNTQYRSEVNSRKLSTFKNLSLMECNMIRSNNDTSNKLIDLLDRMNNFVTALCNNPNILFSSPTPGRFSSLEVELRKNLSEDMDIMLNHRTSYDSFLKLDLTRKCSYDLENIYSSCGEIKEQIFKNTLESHESLEESPYEATRKNISEIERNSEIVLELYKRLFDRCNNSIFEIKNLLMEEVSDELQDNDQRIFVFEHKKSASIDLNKEYLSNKPAKKEVKSASTHTLPIKTEENGLKEKLEKLQQLKIKKEQMAIQKEVFHPKLEDLIASSPFIRKGTAMTDGDTNESILNENILINMPQYKDCIVNKPTDPGNFKLYSDEDSISFRDDSQILINFNNLKDKYDVLDDSAFEKTLNDTIMETYQALARKHTRSRSQIIKKQAGSYVVQQK